MKPPTTLTLLLVLLASSPCASVLSDAEQLPAPPQPEVKPRRGEEARSTFAELDDVHLLANGLLQLGQGLRDFVHKTKSQINEIFQKINIFDRSFYRLSALASEIKEEEEELKKTTAVLKASNDEIKSLSLEVNSKVESVLKERSELQSKVGRLEERLSSLSRSVATTERLADITALQNVIRSQEDSITELLRAVREQSEQLDHQRIKIKSLEKFTFSQETIERSTDVFDPEVPSLTPYLAADSQSSSEIKDLPSDCSDLFNRGERASGIYAVRPTGSEAFMVFCDMNKDGGATVIQRRTDGSVNFDQIWEEYENGFGDFQGDFWLGLKKIHSLQASRGPSLLRVQLEDWRQGKHLIDYSFSLEGPESSYTIHLARPSGDLPDAMMTNHTGMMFSTKDRDNDNHQDSNCAHEYTGGWWFNACGETNLNGRYVHVRPKSRWERRRGIHWRPSRRASYSLRFAQMSVLPAAAAPGPASPTSASSYETGNFL